MNSISCQNATILAVDDNPKNLKVLCSAIANMGWEILVATDGESAVEQAKYAQPDLILLDIMMPEIDGFETCQILKEDSITQEIPIIFMTALSETVDKVKGLSLGAVDYITKPFQPEEVIARIRIHLKLRLLTQELENQNLELEKRVQERTAKLSQVLQELHKFQLQQVQYEKMSSLGQLVAGIAHEINNPLTFIEGSLNYLENFLPNLISHLKLYQQHYPNPTEPIVESANDIELDSMIQDIPELVSSISEGIERISKISHSLRIFSRSDIFHKTSFDIHEGIDSTLVILKYRLRNGKNRFGIEVIKNYGNLPKIRCYPGQLNQVFMNIISNAIDAINEAAKKNLKLDKENHHIINISTSVNSTGTSVIVSIKDNGLGIPPEIKERVFEQFFTTKAVGQGTGLGLSISREIIEQRHEGKLYCFSELNKGTEFIIEIPIKENE